MLAPALREPCFYTDHFFSRELLLEPGKPARLRG
jgi:hypothetical protein